MGSVQSINEIINGSVKIKRSLIINESMKEDKPVEKLCNTNRIPAIEAERRAYRLVEKLNAPDCYKFYLKCVYHLSEAEIENSLEVSTRPGIKSPARYFSTTAKKLLTAKGF